MILSGTEGTEITLDVQIMMDVGNGNVASSDVRINRQKGRSNCTAAAAGTDDESAPRTYVFPFCWPETLAEHQKQFEHFSKISNGEQLVQLHWHEKVIFVIAKPVDFVLALVNKQIWTSQQRSNLPLKSLSFDEKELFWKFAYIKLGMRILRPRIEEEKRIAKQNMQKNVNEETLESNKSDAGKDEHLIDELAKGHAFELEHIFARQHLLLRMAITEILEERIKNNDEIIALMQRLDRIV